MGARSPGMMRWGRRWANQVPAQPGRGSRDGERPGAMETELHQQKFLTLNGELPASPAHLQLGAGGGPQATFSTSSRCSCPRGKAAENTYYSWPSFYVVCRDKEARDNLVRGNPTSGLVGPLGGEGRRGVAGAGDSMWGPWTEQRSWDCPACARCGQPCSRCSPAEPKETGCEYGGSRGARDLWQRGAQPQGALSWGVREGAGVLGRGDLNFCKHLGLGKRAGQRLTLGRPCLTGGWASPPLGFQRSWAVPTCLWTAARRSCARGNRTCCRAFARAPGWAFRSAEASSGTRDGTARWPPPPTGHQPSLWLRAEQRWVPGLADWGLRARPAIPV